MLVNHTVTIETLNDGDWFVPTYQKLTNKILIEPGLYRAKGHKAIINILTKREKTPEK